MAVCRWPLSAKAPNSALSVARSRSASAKTRQGELPASSADSLLRCVAASSMTCWAVAASPANDSRATPGWAISASRAWVPGALRCREPCTMLSAPSGRSAAVAISASSAAGSGAHSSGLSTTVQPAARAGATAQA